MGHPRKSSERLSPVLRQRHGNQQDEILQPTCADHEDGTLTPVDLAVEKGVRLRLPVTTESVDLKHASGRVLAQTLTGASAATLLRLQCDGWLCRQCRGHW